MGMDITMSLINEDGTEIAHDIYTGRCREWFDNLRSEGWDSEFEYLPTTYADVPEAVKLDEKTLRDKYYFGFRYMRADRYIEWFREYRPDLDAGWVTTYDKWRIEAKNYIPDCLDHCLPENANMNDYHFVEVQNPYDNSLWLFNEVIKLDRPDKVWIVYYFDN